MPELYTAGDITRISGADGADATREPGRSPFRKDYSRLLHAPSFRRLQGKTQLFPGTESDFFRNRLTHSLEVAQIAGGIARRLNSLDAQRPQIDPDLVEFAGLAHDLGHPPFGHNGERALDELMRQFGGFEGNAQTLRILGQVERKEIIDRAGIRRYDCGLDLCHRTLASILKYDKVIALERPTGALIEKGYYETEAALVERIKAAVSQGYSGRFKTLECQIMDLADDIAYSTYDLEDSMHAGFATPLTLMDSLINDEQICVAVLRRTNKSLAENGYEGIAAGELWEFAAEIFGDAGFGSSCPAEPNASELLKTALAGVQCFTVDRNLSSNGTSRTFFTADRVGRLISNVELAWNESYPAFSTVRLTRDALIQVEIVKHLNFELVIRSPRLAVVEYRGKDIVRDIFTALRESKGGLLPQDWKSRYHSAQHESEAATCRVICDFVAGMTDRYAVEFHSAIAGEGASIFRPL
ncbi:dGTP triphosphohydrolase [Peristeroidobacter soli]|jgi:dGTPase|uniref:dGTP triphosphohydrolase n=1 Tax=Peristeroidobacter soli TaxID=2497877 RepID=UPI00101B82D2|nr:dNTP triphosphohydrolase [Peristeroidobacter soli]